jgi:YaiO family outer membrane protein
MASAMLLAWLAMHAAVGAPLPDAPAASMLRIEAGGYNSAADRDFGRWRGVELQVTLHARRMTPMVLVSSQTRPTGTQQHYTFSTYVNWSANFYTIQSVALASDVPPASRFFPLRRYDIRALTKLPPNRSEVLSVGYTHFSMGSPVGGDIASLGLIVYRGRLVFEANGFLNRTEPEALYSGSGSLALQYGREGMSWIGVVAGGGRELYQVVGVAPFEVQRDSYTLAAFYRRWLSRHYGIHAGLEYQDRQSAYRRLSVTGRLFVDF